MNKLIFVVDGNWYLHRCFFTLKTSSPNYGEKLALMFLGLVCKDAVAVKATHLLVGFDGPNVFRYKIFPQYKATRKTHESSESFTDVQVQAKDVYQFLPDILALLTELKIPFLQPKTFEADDIGCSAAYKYQQYARIIVGTKDKDSYQFLSDNVCLYDSSFKKNGKPFPRYITSDLAEKIKGVPIKSMIAYQCLLGDSIDNIPSIYTASKAKKLLNTYGSIKNALNQGDEQTKVFLKQSLAKILLNQKLVTLCKTVPLPELNTLVVPRAQLDIQLRNKLPKTYFNYIDMVNPKSHSLF